MDSLNTVKLPLTSGDDTVNRLVRSILAYPNFEVAKVMVNVPYTLDKLIKALDIVESGKDYMKAMHNAGKWDEYPDCFPACAFRDGSCKYCNRGEVQSEYCDGRDHNAFCRRIINEWAIFKNAMLKGSPSAIYQNSVSIQMVEQLASYLISGICAAKEHQLTNLQTKNLLMSMVAFALSEDKGTPNSVIVDRFIAQQEYST